MDLLCLDPSAPDFPPRLREIPDPPARLWIRGDARTLGPTRRQPYAKPITRSRKRGTRITAHSCAACSRSQSGAWSRMTILEASSGLCSASAVAMAASVAALRSALR